MCAKIFCKSCSAKKYNSQRVCDGCHHVAVEAQKLRIEEQQKAEKAGIEKPFTGVDSLHRSGAFSPAAVPLSYVPVPAPSASAPVTYPDAVPGYQQQQPPSMYPQPASVQVTVTVHSGGSGSTASSSSLYPSLAPTQSSYTPYVYQADPQVSGGGGGGGGGGYGGYTSNTANPNVSPSAPPLEEEPPAYAYAPASTSYETYLRQQQQQRR